MNKKYELDKARARATKRKELKAKTFCGTSGGRIVECGPGVCLRSSGRCPILFERFS